jgi:hypothetical protein
MYTLPAASVATSLALVVLPAAPNCRVKSRFPSGPYLLTKTSTVPVWGLPFSPPEVSPVT